MDSNSREVEFMSRADAASVLGVSERSVYRHVQRGKLRKVAVGGRCGVAAEDVHRMIGALNISTRLADVEMSELVSKMAMVTKIVDSKGPLASFAGSNEELVRLFESALYFAEHGFPDAYDVAWADVLLRLAKQDLEALAGLVEQDEVWLPFLQIALSLRPPPNACDDAMLVLAARNHAVLLAVELIESGIGQRALSRQISRLAMVDRNYLRRMERRAPLSGEPTKGQHIQPSRIGTADAMLRDALSQFEASQRPTLKNREKTVPPDENFESPRS